MLLGPYSYLESLVASSDIDICNIALSRIGDRATVSSIDPPEGSAQADHCARFYPLARDFALSARAWSFNTIRTSNDPIYVNPQPGWRFAYAKPNDCLKVLAVVDGQTAYWWKQSSQVPFLLETDDLTGAEIILTDLENAVIVYQRRITDSNVFPPQFVSALAWLLASYIAGPIVKGEAGRKAAVTCYQAYSTEIAAASVTNAAQSSRKQGYTPPSMAARGFSSLYPSYDAPVEGPFGFYAYPSIDNG